MSNDRTQYKDDLPMNILVCGIQIKENYITSLFNDKIKKSSRYISEYKYTEYKYLYGWKFQFFEEGLEKNNLDNIAKKIQNDFKEMTRSSNKKTLENTFKDTIVCFIEDSLDKAKEVITFFSKMSVLYHTFITFITTNQKITLKALKDIVNEIEDEYDSRNLDIIYYKNTDTLPVSLFNTLFYKSCYFNEKGNELILPNINFDSDKIGINQKKNHCFNFLIIGKPGTGKSTFINIMNGLKVAKEGTGNGKMTYNICKYTVKSEENLILYDTPGFGLNDELQKVEKYINEEIISMKEIKEKFHCVIYMQLYSATRTFEDKEKNIIKTLLDLNIPFYFVLNFSSKPKEKKKKKKGNDNKAVLEEEIKNNFPSKLELIKVICLNLKETGNNDGCFGLELLFKDLYNFYEKYKTDLKKLESFSGNMTMTFDLIKNSPFFENMTSKDDIMENIKSRCKKEVIGFSAAAAAVGFIPIPFSDAPLLITIQGSMIIAIAAQFGISLKKAEVAEILKNLSKSVGVGALVAGAGKVIGSLIKIIPGIGTAVGGVISGSTAAVGTTTIGLAAISFFTPDFSDKNIYQFIYERAKSYNNTIDKFKELADKFEKSEDYQYELSPD